MKHGPDKQFFRKTSIRLSEDDYDNLDYLCWVLHLEDRSKVIRYLAKTVANQFRSKKAPEVQEGG